MRYRALIRSCIWRGRRPTSDAEDDGRQRGDDGRRRHTKIRQSHPQSQSSLGTAFGRFFPNTHATPMLMTYSTSIGAENTARFTGSPLGVMTAAMTTIAEHGVLELPHHEPRRDHAEPRQEEHEHRHLEHQPQAPAPSSRRTQTSRRDRAGTGGPARRSAGGRQRGHLVAGEEPPHRRETRRRARSRRRQRTTATRRTRTG